MKMSLFGDLSPNAQTNMSTLVSCISFAVAVGVISKVSLWFLLLAIIPVALALSAGALLYKIGRNENAIKESQARIDMLNRIIDAGSGKE